MSSRSPLIALISAVPAAIPPTHSAFEEHFPCARLWNVIDDRLLVDADEHGGLTPALTARMHRLIDHTIREGADAVLLTCSMYAPAAHEMAPRTSIPILGPDDAVFEAAAHGGYRRITIVSSAADPLADSLHRIRQVISGDVVVDGVVADGGAAAARAGDIDTLADIVSSALTPSLPDAIVLGQFSLAPAAALIEDRTGVTTLAGPHFAVHAMRSRLSGDES